MADVTMPMNGNVIAVKAEVGQKVEEHLSFDDAVDKYQQLFAQSMARQA